MNTPTKIAFLLFEVLEKKGVRYCLWKGTQNIADALAGCKDLDVLVDKEQAVLCEQTLLELKFKRVISKPWAKFPGVEDWMGFDKDSGKLIHVHLYYQILVGRFFVKEQNLPWEKLILDTAVKDSLMNIYIINPSLEILLLAIRFCLETNPLYLLFATKSSVCKKYQVQRAYLLSQTDPKKREKFAVNILGTCVGNQVLQFIKTAQFRIGMFISLRRKLRKDLSPYRRMTNRKAAIIQCFFFMYLVYIKSLHKIFDFAASSKKSFHSGGCLVALIGCDGAGKTTVSRALEDWLAWKIDVQRIYLGSGDDLNGFLERIRKIVLCFYNKRNVSEENSNHSKKPSLLFSCWKAYLALKRMNLVFKARQKSYNGKIVITDRYPQSTFKGIYDGPALGLGETTSFWGKILSAYEAKKYDQIISPDLVIKLHIPAEVALKRKPDHLISILEEKAKITEKLVYPGIAVINIDAARPLDEVLQKIKQTLWEIF